MKRVVAKMTTYKLCNILLSMEIKYLFIIIIIVIGLLVN